MSAEAARETDPRALASMASFGLLLNEAEVCLLADFTRDLLLFLEEGANLYGDSRVGFALSEWQDRAHTILSSEDPSLAARSPSRTERGEG